MKKILFFITLLSIFSFTSCLNDENIAENTNPYIERFYFNEHDKISGIENITFIIDSIAGLIYNEDSASINCDFSKVVPVVDTYETLKSISINEKQWNYTDTIDMNNPITISTVSGNKKNKASYIVTINKHTVEPDSIIWSKTLINENNITSIKADSYKDNFYLLFSNNLGETKIYSSNNGINFTLLYNQVGFSLNFYKSIFHNEKCYVTSIDNKSLFYIDLSNISSGFTSITLPENSEIIDMWGVINDKLFATLYSDAPQYMSYNGTSWAEERCNMLNELTTIGSAKIHSNNSLFVISGSINENLTNNVLATQDGNYWINTINQSDTLQYEPVKNACVVDYYDYFYILGGTNNNGKTPTSFYSKNDGYSWNPLKSYQRPTKDFSPKENMAACELNNYIYIFNCSNTSNIEVWKGKINKVDFIIK